MLKLTIQSAYVVCYSVYYHKTHIYSHMRHWNQYIEPNDGARAGTLV